MVVCRSGTSLSLGYLDSKEERVMTVVFVRAIIHSASEKVTPVFVRGAATRLAEFQIQNCNQETCKKNTVLPGNGTEKIFGRGWLPYDTPPHYRRTGRLL